MLIFIVQCIFIICIRIAGIKDSAGWAFGMGLDRLALLMYSNPDIRFLWSTDVRFLSQFAKASPRDKVTFQVKSLT